MHKADLFVCCMMLLKRALNAREIKDINFDVKMEMCFSYSLACEITIEKTTNIKHINHTRIMPINSYYLNIDFNQFSFQLLQWKKDGSNFIFQLREYQCNIIHDMFFFLYTTDIFRTRTDIPRIFLEYECIFLRVNVTFYDAVNMIHDVIWDVEKKNK